MMTFFQNKNIFIIFVSFAVLFFFLSLFLLFRNHNYSPPLPSLVNFNHPLPTPTPLPENQFSAWVPWWDETSAVQSLSHLSPGQLASLSPLWFRLDPQGQLETVVHPESSPVFSSAQTVGIALMPTLANDFDPQGVHLLLTQPFLQQTLADQLIALADQYKFSGWDLDWEELHPQDCPLYSDFVTYLADQLHQHQLFLSVSAYAQTGLSSDWKGGKCHDLTALSRSADKVRLMAYDYHHQDSSPGPVTPLTWLDQVLTFTTQIIPPQKLVLGLPTYGYDWNSQETTSSQYQDTVRQLQALNLTPQRDSQSQALTITFRQSGVKHQLWFEDAQSSAAKISLARSRGVYQFCFWHLGKEDPAIWDL
jgi:spore germination protein